MNKAPSVLSSYPDLRTCYIHVYLLSHFILLESASIKPLHSTPFQKHWVFTASQLGGLNFIRPNFSQILNQRSVLIK